MAEGDQTRSDKIKIRIYQIRYPHLGWRGPISRYRRGAPVNQIRGLNSNVVNRRYQRFDRYQRMYRSMPSCRVQQFLGRLLRWSSRE